MKKISEQITDLEATRAARIKRLDAITEKSRTEGRSMADDEATEFDAVAAEIKRLDADLGRLKAMEGFEAAGASTVSPIAQRNAGVPMTPATPNTLVVKNTETLEPGIGFARAARCLYQSQTHKVPVADVAKHLYPSDERLHAALVNKAPVPAASTLSDPWAANLILDRGAAFADFVEYLRPRTIYGQVSPKLRHIPFDTPVLIQGTAGAAKWVKEGAAKPLTSWTYTRAKLEPLKVAAIAAATKEMLSRASMAADTLLRDELARAVGAAIDTTFVSDNAAVTDESPAGIRAGVGALTLTGDGSVAGIRCDAAAMLTELVGDNLSVSGAFWVMSEVTAINLSLIANEVGATAFPGIGPTGGTFVGLPVYVSQYVADETAGPVVMLIKGDEVFAADEGGIQVSISDQASLLMDSAPAASMNSTTPTGSATLVSLWQTNSVGFLVERFLNWQKRRAQAVVWANVNWTACPTP